MEKRNLIEKAMERMPAREDASGQESPKPLDKQSAPPKVTAPGGQREVRIDLDRLKAMNFVTPDGERSMLAEEYRMIKRPLLANAYGKNADLVEHGNLIMITSARAGEGKTFTAINLAISMALEMDKTVLLVDADVGRARVHQVLGTPSGPGLIDLLLDEKLDVSDVMLRTNIDKLRIIPKGRYHPHSTELLASEDMLRMTRDLASRYQDRIVIFDAPPLLVTSEAAVLSGLMGQIVFVVHAEKTQQHAVRDALGMLDSNKPIGLVLNKARRGPGDSYYGYGYGYGDHGKS